jgi:serine/threonine protein kinase
LIAKGITHEFYTNSEEVTQTWIDALKHSVILMDAFQELQVEKDVIGSGNFAQVNLCWKISEPSKKYALKTIEKTKILKNRRTIEAILLEIDIMRNIDHENCLKMYEIYESSKYLHLLLPYLEGGELFERIKAKTLYKESDAIQVMKLLLSALEYMAFQKIVHRDLKPENLLLAKKGDDSSLVIADFGLAAYITEEEKLLYQRCGTPGYVAPELLEDKGYDTQADMFSAGVIMYVMLTGKQLFTGKITEEVLDKNEKCELYFPT